MKYFCLVIFVFVLFCLQSFTTSLPADYVSKFDRSASVYAYVLLESGDYVVSDVYTMTVPDKIGTETDRGGNLLATKLYAHTKDYMKLEPADRRRAAYHYDFTRSDVEKHRKEFIDRMRNKGLKLLTTYYEFGFKFNYKED